MHQYMDLIGIGLGPSNLSLAALSTHSTKLKSVFFEKKETFSWHPGMLLPDAKMQTSFVKDLVTCVDPTNPYSFLNYVVKQGHIYPFLASGQTTLSRLEFCRYMQWVAHQLPNTQFGAHIEDIEYKKPYFIVRHQGKCYKAKHLVVGTGITPYTPACAMPFLSKHCFHTNELALSQPNLHNKRVVIVGGGQSGADAFLSVYNKHFGKPKHIHWLSRRANIESLDEGCFTDEYYMPNYIEPFYHLNNMVKQREISHQKLTSDGITSDCLAQLYSQLYQDKYVLNTPKWWMITPHQTLVDMSINPQGYRLQLQHGLNQTISSINADVVILCTGFNHLIPPCFEGLLGEFITDEQERITLNENYDAIWKKPSPNRVYFVNAGLHSHGIADPQLSLISWRSAKIINHIVGKPVFELLHTPSVIDWQLCSDTNGHKNQINSPNNSLDELTSFN